MNLESFIEESLTQVVQGITNAQAKLVHSSAIINPFRVGMTGFHIEEIKFDVAVEASSGSGTKGGGGINVLGGFMNASGQKEQTKNENTISRISFSVPIVLPLPPEKKDEKGA